MFSWSNGIILMTAIILKGSSMTQGELTLYFDTHNSKSADNQILLLAL